MVPTRSLRASIALGLLLPQLAGCYQYVPVSSSAMPVGATVSVSPTDRGRLELAPLLGSGLRRLDGRVLESTDSALVLAVTSVQLFGEGEPGKWSGERVAVSRDFVSELRERRHSRARTGIAAGLAVVAAIAASTLAIKGSGGDLGDGRSGGGGSVDQ